MYIVHFAHVDTEFRMSLVIYRVEYALCVHILWTVIEELRITQCWISLPSLLPLNSSSCAAILSAASIDQLGEKRLEGFLCVYMSLCVYMTK